MGLLLCKKEFRNKFCVAYFAKKKKNRFAVGKGIHGGKNGLIQVLGNNSGGNGGPFFSLINKTLKPLFCRCQINVKLCFL